MSIDDQISAFAAQLDRWFADFAAKLLQPGDETAEVKTRVAGLKLLKQFDELKSQGLASLATLSNFADVASESERIETLLRGFERAARLEGISNDLQDWDGVKQIDHIMDDIVVALAAIGPGRTLLVPLLKHDNARVRVLAGRYLIDLMPDRVVPILEKIDKEGDGSSDGFSAFLVLQVWEVERRGRFNAIEGRVVRG
ncbi:MAG TPA: hypothetical protein VNZ23_01870 [Xanthobacteraceae bacterium]|jgi:hypothetical protein|nr:hypothetical protein [Xanthobacteraceae bacterium]